MSPAIRETEFITDTEPTVKSPARVQLKQIKVLVVDDQEEDFHYISYLLRGNPGATYELKWAPNFANALELMQSDFDVGIFDYRMGAHTGIELLRESIRRGCEKPIILLTGYDSPEIDQEAADAGAADYLCKVGLNRVQLERSIRYSLRQASMLDALRKSQRQLELFMRNVPCAVCISDERGELLFQNGLYQQYFKDLAVATVASRKTGSEPWPYTDGTHHWLVSSFQMVEAGGRILNGFAAVDITDRILAEDNLKQTTRVLNGILSSLPVLAGSLDADGTILETRGRGLEEVGLSRDSLVGKNFADRFPGSGPSISKALQGGSVNFLWDVTYEGRAHYFDTYLHFDQERGSGAIGFAVDVTARIEAEAARNRKQQLLQAVMNNLPLIAGKLDADGKVSEAEGEGLSVRNITPEKILGRPFSEIYPHSREVLAQIRDGGSVNFTLSGRNGDQNWHVEFSLSKDAEHPDGGTIFFGHDVTERRWLEGKLLNMSDAEQQRIGADLHDGLGQHLTGIAFLATALRDRLAPTASAESKQANTIAGLVNDAITQSRALARGLCPVQLEQGGLQSAIEDLTYHIQLLHGMECRFEAVGPTVLFPHHVAVQLYRITQEAISNSLRHGHSKHIRVVLDTSGPEYRLLVEDDGIGFDPIATRRAPGVGLRLMNYRAAIVSGTFSINVRPEGGMRVECTFHPPITK